MIKQSPLYTFMIQVEYVELGDHMLINGSIYEVIGKRYDVRGYLLIGLKDSAENTVLQIMFTNISNEVILVT